MRTAVRIALVACLVSISFDSPVLAETEDTTEAPSSDTADNDPLEPYNRGMFWFNDKIDVYVLEPAARGWKFITPQQVRTSLSHFFQNLRFPRKLINNVLQGKPRFAAKTVGRFAVNTTVGVLGFFDPATGWGLEDHDEDFGQTLGKWGVPPGPYLVLPLWGPSNPRDTVGLAADSFSAVYAYFIDIQYTIAASAVDVVNSRTFYLKEVEELKRASFDYYVAVRNAYVQRRRALIRDEEELSAEEQEELYYYDDMEGDDL